MKRSILGYKVQTEISITAKITMSDKTTTGQYFSYIVSKEMLHV